MQHLLLGAPCKLARMCRLARTLWVAPSTPRQQDRLHLVSNESKGLSRKLLEFRIMGIVRVCPECIMWFGHRAELISRELHMEPRGLQSCLKSRQPSFSGALTKRTRQIQKKCVSVNGCQHQRLFCLVQARQARRPTDGTLTATLQII